MQINLTKLAEFETKCKCPSTQEGVVSLPDSATFALVMEALYKYYQTPVEDEETLEHLFPIYQDLQRLGVVSDAPEMELLDDEEESDEEGPDYDEEEE